MLRRFRIKKNEYEGVLGWLRQQKVDEEEDEKSPEPLQQKFSMPGDWLPKVTWAHKAGPLRLKKAAHGKHVIEVQEKGAWKTLVHEGAIDGLLRQELLSSNSDVPLTRDAGYHVVQKRTVGISRRAFGAFIAKQAVLQITRDRLPEKENPGRPLEKRGYLELDLVEAKGRDIGKYVHHPVSDFYWITLVDRLTGWLEVESIPNKAVATVAPKLEKMLKRMARTLKTDVKYIRSDKGSEFKAETQEVLKQLGIRHKFVHSGNRIEQANKLWQKIWYRLMRLGRGDLRGRDGRLKLDTQAHAIFNNTLSSVTGKTPLEALDVSDKVLSTAYNEARLKRKVPKYKAVLIKKGDRVRYLLESEVGKHGKALAYKSYRGKHWSAKVYTVVKIKWEHDKDGERIVNSDTYYAGGLYRDRDKLLKVPGVDRITHDAVVQKHRERFANYQDEIGDMALGDPEDQP